VLVGVFVAVVLTSVVGGCAPQNIGRYNEIAFGDTKRVRNRILKTHDDWYSDLTYWIQGDVEETEDFPGPTAVDLRPPEGDYILGAGDVVQVTIQDLFAEGRPWIQTVRVGEEGDISLPVSFLQDVKAGGFTARGLERRLADRLKPPDGPLREPRVSVFIMEFRNRRYAIVGAVRSPGMYPVVAHEMNLFEAISQAGGVTPFHEQYIYVVRNMTEDELAEMLLRSWAEEPEPQGEPEEESPAGGAPEAGGEAPPEEGPPGAEATEPPAEKKLTDLEELQAVAEGRKPEVAEDEGEPSPAPPAPTPSEVVPPEPPLPAEDGGPGWVFKEGQWVRVEPAGAPETVEEPKVEELPDLTASLEELPAGLQERMARLGIIQAGGGLRRVIRIDVGALIAGDQSQNMVMRHGDLVNIPEPPAGEWYIDGEIVRRGVYSLTGRKITLLQAVAAAGGLTQLAIPWRTELVRRVSDEAEEIIYVDLAKIARGEAPDFFLQPEDLIRVGTDQGAIFLAVLRNAFRATYGFGLVYDQNFADIYPWKGGIHPLF